MLTKRNDAELRTTIPADLDAALTAAVQLSGTSKATFVRQALAAHLSSLGLLPPDAATQIQSTLTGGPGLAALRRKD